MKKVAILCAMVMLVSIVPAFAASQTNGDTSTNLQDKHQYKYQNGLKDNQNGQQNAQNGNSQGNGDQTKLQQQLKTQDCTCDGTQTGRSDKDPETTENKRLHWQLNLKAFKN